jgi:hypothetical protein
MFSYRSPGKKIITSIILIFILKNDLILNHSRIFYHKTMKRKEKKITWYEFQSLTVSPSFCEDIKRQR